MSRILAGRSFFIEHSSPRVRCLEDIESRITKNGGTVATWFSRSVKYLVTSTPESEEKGMPEVFTLYQLCPIKRRSQKEETVSIIFCDLPEAFSFMDNSTI